MEEEKRLRTRMLATGKILFDTEGIVKQLQKEARKLLKKKLPSKSVEWIELRKYFLWDQLDNLRVLAQQCAPGFSYDYYACLQEILAFYATCLRVEIPRPNRMYNFLTDKEFRRRYNIAPLPDTAFVNLFEKAMREPSLQIIEQLTTYVHEHTGGFSIDGWILRRRMPHKSSGEERK